MDDVTKKTMEMLVHALKACRAEVVRTTGPTANCLQTTDDALRRAGKVAQVELLRNDLEEATAKCDRLRVTLKEVERLKRMLEEPRGPEPEPHPDQTALNMGGRGHE